MLMCKTLAAGCLDAAVKVERSLMQPVVGGDVRLSRGAAFLFPQAAPAGAAAGAAPGGAAIDCDTGAAASPQVHNWTHRGCFLQTVQARQQLCLWGVVLHVARTAPTLLISAARQEQARAGAVTCRQLATRQAQ